jgi:hypothetical protein
LVSGIKSIKEYPMNSLSSTKPMVHYAKVDWWVPLAFGGGAMVGVTVAALLLVAGLSTDAQAPPAALAAIPLCVGMLMGLLLWGCYRIHYEITASDVIVHCGPFRTTVPLDAIVEVFPTRDATQAPAPSLDRLNLSYWDKNGGKAFVLISPKNKEGFVRDLASAAPRLRRVGDGALRLKAEQPA